MNNGKNKAIFFDRDGTIIKDKNYLKDPSEIEYLPGFFEAYQKVTEMGYMTFLITNQSGVGRGYFTLEDVNLVHHQMQRDLINQGLKPFKDIKVCPHTQNENCECRKPKPYMLTELISQYGIDPRASYMLGDKAIDLELGKNAGVPAILILSHQSPPEQKGFQSILEFVNTLS